MRRICRVDNNQQLVVRALREIGCSVEHLHVIGRGVPDLLVGCEGTNFLFELKDGSKSPSKQRLTPDELIWHEQWKGQVAVISSVEQALKIVASHFLDFSH